MATKAVNAKSQTLAARIPHDIVEGMDKVKEPGESSGQFIVTAMQGEIKRRLRRAPKEHLKSEPEQPTSTETQSPKNSGDKPLSPKTGRSKR